MTMSQSEKPSESRYSLLVHEISSGSRLDTCIASMLPAELSRARVQALIKTGNVLLNGKASKASARVKTGDVVEITVPPQEPWDVTPEDIPLDVVYQDEDMLVINKSRGMVVHPGAGHRGGTLVNAVLNLCPDLPRIGGEVRPGIVHRLDKDTTGLLVVAKTESALRSLQKQIKEGQAARVYLALCKGRFGLSSGTVDAPIGRHPRDRKRMAVVNAGRSAVTEYRVMVGFGNEYSLILARLRTGRTHQIRVHMAYLRHPVVADPVYSRTKGELGLRSQALHAFELGFTKPSTGEYVEFTALPPADFMNALKTLSRRYKEELPQWLT